MLAHRFCTSSHRIQTAPEAHRESTMEVWLRVLHSHLAKATRRGGRDVGTGSTPIFSE
jgi:hypothetical protein